MATKLIVLTGQDPVSYRDADEGDKQALLLLADGLTSPQVYPDDYDVCPPVAGPPGPIAAGVVLPESPEGAPAGVVYADSGLLSVTPAALASAVLIKHSLPLPRYELQEGQVLPRLTWSTFFKIDEANPTFDTSNGLVQFGFLSQDSGAAFYLQVWNDPSDGNVKTKVKIQGPTLTTQEQALITSLVADRWYQVVLELAPVNDSGPAGALQSKIITYSDGIDSAPTDVASYSDITMTLEQLEQIQRKLVDLPGVVLYATQDTQDWTVDFDGVRFG